MGDPSGEAAEIEDDWAEANSGRVSWTRIMNKGLGLGKKILVTGFVISSAPLVLPPLVVISAIGFTFCVPSGVVLASYACTEKLMNKLLPGSTPPRLFENGTLMSNDDEEEEQGTWVGGQVDTEKVEGWDSGDILGGGEMSIELVEEEIFEEGRIEEGDECGQEGDKKNAQEYFAENENGYEEDVGKSTDVAEEIEILVEDQILDIGLEKPAGTMEGGVGKVPKECEDMQEHQDMKHVNDANTGVSGHVKPTGDIGSVWESKNADNNLEAEKPINVSNTLEPQKSMAETRNLRPVMSSIVEDKQKALISKEEIVLQGRRAEDNIKNFNFQLIREKETSNADAREIADESGLHFFDEKNVSGQEYTYETSEGHVIDEGAELPVSLSPHESTDAVISSGKDVSMHPNRVLYDEAKIWRQIDALRSIVGYKDTPHATCIEELKALYRFTGVEPPASFGDHPDLAQVNDKLRFLMSIIGVKLD